MEEIINRTKPISVNTPLVITIHDEIEGNMEFTFKMVNDEFNSSYTKYNVINEHCAEIIISNVGGNGVKPERAFVVGTYRNRYKLFVNYVLFKENDDWMLEYSFLIEPIKDGNN